MSRRMTLVAVLVPLLGLATLAGRAEYAVRNGPVWIIPIDGFDPRDLLHGQYLQYRYRLRWDGIDTCGDVADAARELSPGCCLCLQRGDSDGFDPAVHQLPCSSAAETCEAWVHSEAMMGQQRYFVPEDRAGELESALRSHPAAIELATTPQGEPAVRELLLDRRPWRDVLGR